MRKISLGFGAAALALSVAACGATDQPANDIAIEESNALANSAELPQVVAPVDNGGSDAAVTGTPQAEPQAATPAPAKPAVAKPKPVAAKPKVEPAAEPKAAEETCTQEHREMGHCK